LHFVKNPNPICTQINHCGLARHTGIVTDKDFLTQNDECYRYENDEKPVKMAIFV
jgi:hypothetical protein